MNDTFFSLVLSDGNTVPSVELDGTKTYIDIGSGTILKISWSNPGIDIFKYYVCIGYHTGETTRLLDTIDVGRVNEFYLRSSMLSSLTSVNNKLVIHVEGVNSDYSLSVVSYDVEINITKGCGTYIKVTDGYTQPVMKRSVALARLPQDNSWKVMQEFYLNGEGQNILTDIDGVELADEAGELLYAGVSTWYKSNIKYEILTDINGGIVLDKNNEPIYIL